MMDAKALCNSNKLVKMYAGSIAYGTNLPTSDVDFRGIFCGNPENVRTPFYNIKEYDDSSEEDTKYFELSHFMKLCLDCNPNIVELLWTPTQFITQSTPAYELLRSHRKELLSNKIAFTTTGYAMSQLQRIKGHNKWLVQEERAIEKLQGGISTKQITKEFVQQNYEPAIVDQLSFTDDSLLNGGPYSNNDPDVMLIANKKPGQFLFVSLVQWFGKERILPRDFNLTDYNTGYQLIPYGNGICGLYVNENKNTINQSNGSLNTTFDGERHTLDTPLAVVRLHQDDWKHACDTNANYRRWKENRNEARSELEMLHGYDTKHAMHLVRLLRMGVETLTTGELVIHRPDAKELLEIRNGSMKYEELLEYANEMEQQVKTAVQASNLPKRPNIQLASKLLMEMQDLVWNK